jgi:hypothetical protein
MYRMNFVADTLYIGVGDLQLVIYASHYHLNSLHPLSDAFHIFVNAVNNSQSFCPCHESLLCPDIFQLLNRVIQAIYSRQPLDKLLCVKRQFRGMYQREKAY